MLSFGVFLLFLILLAIVTRGKKYPDKGAGPKAYDGRKSANPR